MISRQKLMEDIKKWQKEAEPEEARVMGDIICLIEDQPPADQWIPCSERLPEASGYYEVTVEEIVVDGIERRFRTFAGYLLSHNKWVTSIMHSCVVVAWREPLPEPYKGVE